MSTNLVDIFVHHGEGNTNANDGNNRESDGRIGHEPISLYPVFEIHSVCRYYVASMDEVNAVIPMKAPLIPWTSPIPLLYVECDR